MKARFLLAGDVIFVFSQGESVKVTSSRKDGDLMILKFDNGTSGVRKLDEEVLVCRNGVIR